MAKEFEKNRNKIQEYFLATDFLVPLNRDNLPLEIEEKKNKAKNRVANPNELELALLTIDKIPFSQNEDKPISWVLDLELENKIFSTAQGFKKGEKAILFFSCTTLYVLIIEMKNDLKAYQTDDTLDNIATKISHSISRISMLLPSYLFDNQAIYDNIDICYKAIICYNSEFITQQVINDESIKSKILYNVFANRDRYKHVYLPDEFGEQHHVEIFFCQNRTSNKTEMKIDLATILEESHDNYDFLTCEHNTELSCP